MPKRKAVGPVDSSDGEEEDYSSFPVATSQPSFPIVASEDFPFGKSTATSAASSSVLCPGGSSKRPAVLGKPPNFGLTTKAQSTPLTNVMPLTSSNSSTGSSNQEFTKSMRDLNNAFNKSVRNSVSKNSSHSLVPLVKDYLYHSRVLLEQCKRGGAQAELVNGINVPPNNFKSLGEFFDDFEARYIAGGALSSSSGALNTKFPSVTETGSKPNFLSTFSSIPSKPTDNTKLASLPHPENISLKVNPNSSSSSVGTIGSISKPEADRTITSGFFANAMTSVASPLKTSSPLASSSPSKSSTESAQPVTKPAITAPFAGFSFFTPPAPSTSIALGSFQTTTTASSSEEKNNDEDGEDEEPPKVEVTPVKEDDSVYSIRCKVFGVVDGKCKDKGIGMLYVKKLEDGRHQIVVRADNNLGTVILNILLQKSLPLEKNGKNSIMTMDLQANDKKGMPIFIRVKTEEDAIELLKKLKEYQQSS